MTILVTGVAGFIGSNFVYYYLRRHPERKLIGLDNLTYAGNLDNLSRLTEEEKKRFTFIKGDICDTELVDLIFSENEIDGVINFAAESHVDRSIHDPQIFLKTNILGTQVLLDAAKNHWQLPDGKWQKSRPEGRGRNDRYRIAFHEQRTTNNAQHPSFFRSQPTKYMDLSDPQDTSRRRHHWIRTVHIRRRKPRQI